jgi:alkylhydroperoxidase family enzyme
LSQETLNAVLDDWTTADIPAKTRGALELLEAMTLHPGDINPDFVDKIRSYGLDDLAIREAANVGFHYNLIDRVADAFDFPVPEGIQKKRLAKMLDFTGGLLRGSYADQVWVQGEDGVIRPSEVESGRSHLLNISGETAPELRKVVEAFVVAQWGVEREQGIDLPDELKTYLKKLSLHAYKITDEDVDSLKSSGYSDDMIYEITLVGAVGAALVGLERLFYAMYGSKVE